MEDKGKEKEVEEPKTNILEAAAEKRFLDLKLMQKFQDCPKASSPTPREAKRHNYACHYCYQTFYSAQALGGHQNCHKHERALAKQLKRMVDLATSRHIDDRYPGFRMRSLMNHPPYYPIIPQLGLGYAPIPMSLQYSPMPQMTMGNYAAGDGGRFRVPAVGTMSFNGTAAVRRAFGSISGRDDQQKGGDLEGGQHGQLGLDLSLKL